MVVLAFFENVDELVEVEVDQILVESNVGCLEVLGNESDRAVNNGRVCIALVADLDFVKQRIFQINVVNEMLQIEAAFKQRNAGEFVAELESDLTERLPGYF